MGYEVHLSKSESWTDEENRFSQTEWEVVRPAPGSDDWLYYDGRDISVKNPSKQQIVALVKIARANGWRVLGDEDEEYDESGDAIDVEPARPARKPWNPLKTWLDRKEMQKRVGPAPFKVGDRVRFEFIGEPKGTVIAVDPRANHGVGSFTVRLDHGHVQSWMFIGHGLVKDEER